MTTAANLLIVLLFLSALYTFLGLVCGLVEKVQEVMARPHQRRRVRKDPRRRTPRRALVTASGGSRARGPLGTAGGKAA